MLIFVQYLYGLRGRLVSPTRAHALKCAFVEKTDVTHYVSRLNSMLKMSTSIQFFQPREKENIIPMS